MASPVAIAAEHLAVDGPRGPVFTDVSFAAEPGQVVAVAGPGESGRTSLLLTLAGRMKATGGTARVGSNTIPGDEPAVRRLVSVGRAGGAVELDPNWRVRETIGLRGVLRGHSVSPREAADALAAVGIDPGGEALLRDLPVVERTLLAIALTLLEDPPAAIVDDVDRGAGRAAERRVWDALRGLAERGTTVLAVTTDAVAAAGLAHHTVEL